MPRHTTKWIGSQVISILIDRRAEIHTGDQNVSLIVGSYLSPMLTRHAPKITDSSLEKNDGSGHYGRLIFPWWVGFSVLTKVWIEVYGTVLAPKRGGAHERFKTGPYLDRP